MLVVQQQIVRRRDQLMVAGPVTAHDLVLIWLDGSAYSPDHVSRRFMLLSKRAGLPVGRLHDLRHGSAWLQSAAGAPVAVVSQRFGPSTITSPAALVLRRANADG